MTRNGIVRWTAAFVALATCAGSSCADPLPAKDERPTTAEICQSVERGLVFLEKGGVAWMKERGCASCHHVPFLLWSHNEARRRGFPVDDQKVEAWTNWTLLDMLARGDGGGLETLTQVLLGRDSSSAWRQKPPKHLKTADPYETLWGLLLDKQKPDGSFPSEGQRSFPQDLSTSWALLALASRDTVKAPKDVTEGLKKNRFGPGLTVQLQKLEERIPKSQERAVAWLKSAKPDDSTQSVLLRMLVAAKLGAPDRAEAMQKELVARQKPDGGWSYQNGGKQSDAFATGQALYALRLVKVKADAPVIVGARQFLLKSQRLDGSWSVSSHSIHTEKVSDEYRRKTDVVYSYWGTAWATIGLLHTLPVQKEDPGVGGRDPVKEPTLIAKPGAFETLVHPNCSHCLVEAKRRKDELQSDDRVLCWIQVGTDGYINDGAIPLRFFLNTYRILDDGWGLFVYDPDAGFARGFAPGGGPFRFHGWRNGVMVIKSPDGTLYSGLTGIAFEGPKKGKRLQPEPTLVSDWGFWQNRYPQAVAFTMYDKYKPVNLPTEVNGDSHKSRGPADGRLPADTMVLGVWDGKQARAYPLDILKKTGVIHDVANGQPRVVFWYGPTRTAAAYRQPWGTSGLQGDAGWIFSVDAKVEAAPFVDKRTGLHWDITGRPVEGGPKLIWLDSVQVKWFAWVAEYPETSIYEKDAPKPDYKPLTPKSLDVPGPRGDLDVTSRRFGILKATDPRRQRITLVLEGETEPREWPLRLGAEVWNAGSWGRLDQFTVGDRVWVWFETDRAKQPLEISLLADELSEQDLYAPVKIKGVNTSGSDPGTVTLETVRGGKPTARTVKLAKAEVFRGDAKAPRDSLKVGEQVHVQTTGADARLILDPAAFQKRRSAQKAALRKRWADEGLPGTLIFSHPQRREVELMLDHEAMRWGRSLHVGDKVTLQAAKPIPAVVRQLRPWQERTQVLLGIDDSEVSVLTGGQRVSLRLVAPPAADDEKLPPGLGKSENKPERIEWFMSGIYCTCGMHDGCAGHFFTLAACNSGPSDPCGMAKRTRAEVSVMIDKGQTDRQIFEELLKRRSPKLLRPHMSP